jgi:hypothetical protein
MKFFVVLHTLLLGALVSSPAWAGNNAQVVEIVTSASQRWHFRQVLLRDTDSGLVVSGKMYAPLRFGLPEGHIDIAAWSVDGELIAETTTSYHPGLLTRRIARKGGVSFSATLPESIPADARIEVAFHQEKPEVQTAPAHDATVAR